MSYTAWTALGIVFALSMILIAYYNRFIALGRRCDQAFADIDVQLKQRQDLIPNLLETVKGYAGHERATLEAVIKARCAAQTAPTPEARMQAEAGLSAALEATYQGPEAVIEGLFRLQEKILEQERKSA